MPILHCKAWLAIGVIAVAVTGTLPSQVHGQIGKVDARHVEPCYGGWSFFGLHSICTNGICPSCKRRYCPLDLPNFGYSAPRWQAFPGTNPNFTPKKKDVGISTPGPAPVVPEPGTTGAMLKPRPKASEQASPQVTNRELPEVSPALQAPVKPVIIPEIQPDDGDK